MVGQCTLRLGPAASHSTSGQPATDPPTGQPKVPANSRHPGPREFPAAYFLAIPAHRSSRRRHRGPVWRLKTVRRPPFCPNVAQAISPVVPSLSFRCPRAAHRWDSGLNARAPTLPNGVRRGQPFPAALMGLAMRRLSSQDCR